MRGLLCGFVMDLCFGSDFDFAVFEFHIRIEIPSHSLQHAAAVLVPGMRCLLVLVHIAMCKQTLSEYREVYFMDIAANNSCTRRGYE